MQVLVALVLLAALVGLWASSLAAITVCLLEVRDGKLRVARGGIAPGVLSDLGDVVARPPIARATLRIIRSGGYARLVVRGDVPEAQQQALRNVIGTTPLAKLARAPRR